MGKEERRQQQQKARSWKADGQVVNNMVALRKLNPESAVEKQNKQPNLHQRIPKRFRSWCLPLPLEVGVKG